MTATRGTALQRVRGRFVELLSALACRLPERPLIAVAGIAGELWLAADRERAERGRHNLRRVCEWLASNGAGPESAREAARDRRALERLLRSASRHHARYYLENLRAPGLTPERVRSQVDVEEEGGRTSVFDVRGGLVVIGLHFGALELPAIYLSERFGRDAVVPMETVGDPVLQRWFERTRSFVGLRIVPIAAAKAELLAALAEGGIAGLVADRDIAGGGIEVPFFGHPAPFPIGGALVAIETGVPAFVVGAQRTGDGRFHGRIIGLEMPADGSRRERVTAFLAAQAAAFERIIAGAPDQWWSAFFPIWRDLEGERR